MKIFAILFRHDDRFYCACKDICLLSEDTSSFRGAVDKVKKMLQIYLNDENYSRLRKMGWENKGNSIIAINFAEKDIVEYANSFFKKKITNYQLVEINVEPEPGD